MVGYDIGNWVLDIRNSSVMSRRMDKVNKHIQRTFAEIVEREADLPVDVLVTISGVETAPNLQTATIWLSVLPADQAGAVLKKLKPQMYELQGSFNRQLAMKPLPRLVLRIDHGAEHTANISTILERLE